MIELSLDMPVVKIACIVGFTVIIMAILTIAFFAIPEIADRLPKYVRRRRGITRALRCDMCMHNVDGRCDQWDYDVEHAPVRCPGCTWGVRKERES